MIPIAPQVWAARVLSPFKLKLASGKCVEYKGVDGEDAARRYMTRHRADPDEAVVATKPVRHGLFIGAPERTVDGPCERAS